MSDKVVFIPNGDNVYAVPVETVEQYKLEGKQLETAKEILFGENDVEGQAVIRRDEYGRAYADYGDGKWQRQSWADKSTESW